MPRCVGLHRLGRSFWLLLLAEIFTSLGSYTQAAFGVSSFSVELMSVFVALLFHYAVIQFEY